MTGLSILLILITIATSWKGLKDRSFFDRYHFNIDKVLVFKEYYRILTSGFLHVSWIHLIFNMISLYAFSEALEFSIGPFLFLLIYFTSLVGGGLLSLFIHRNHGNYSAVGASGAVSGIIFAFIAIFPHSSIGFFLLPSIPAWIYGLLYVLISIIGIRSRVDNIGHDAHLGGAVIGMITAVAIRPGVWEENYGTILVIAIPAMTFIYIIATRPHLLLTDTLFSKTQQKYYSVDHRYNAQRVERQKEIDRILEKISSKGIKSLTRKEKEILEQHSKTV
jgi:membrane associated rhomboid family serine protease